MLRSALVRRCVVSSASFCVLAGALAQEPENGWLQPPPVIAQLVTAPAPPSVGMSPQGQLLVLTTSEPLPGLDVVARSHLKLAGMRIDPDTWSRQLDTKVTAIEVRTLPQGKVHRVPVEPDHWSGPIWSDDDRAFALVRNAVGGGELWVADPYTAPLRRIEGLRLNQVLGSAVQWLPDQQRLLVRRIVPGERPAQPAVPNGPQIQFSVRGQKAQVRTYPDLLQDRHDGDLLEFYGTSQLAIVTVGTGSVQNIGEPAMYGRVDPSPDGTLLLVETIARPFSYIVPLSRFPGATTILGIDGQQVRVLHTHRLLDAIPIGGVEKGPRQIGWVPTTQHALQWVEAQDEGDPNRSVAHRDYAFLLASPADTPRLWFKTEHRAEGVRFGSDSQLVLASELDRRTYTERVWRYDLAKPGQSGTLVYERSTQDVYGDPGQPVSEHLPDGRRVLRMSGDRLFLAGSGASPQGNRPFLDSWVVATGEKRRLFQSADDRNESFLGFVAGGDTQFLVRSESQKEPPSLVLVDLDSGQRQTLLTLEDPAAKWTASVQQRLLRYEREDGVPMNGTLYLPPGYQDGDKLPCLLWAYPREYVQASDAGQVRATPNRYLQLRGSSHLLLLLHGYAVFDNASMPIVGPRDSANDTFVEQVRMNARAAVKALVAEGCIDEKKIAVAGHSYGAFMTANLLAHSDLFACGIARSGAYNRTLTPFGFQNEERTYWQAPDVYFAMSPFCHADKINEPLLLIHGNDDNNAGTFPIQSQRLFVAIKGHGGTVRLCMLPHESHGYSGRENVLHCLAEMCAWLDTHCKASGG